MNRIARTLSIALLLPVLPLDDAIAQQTYDRFAVAKPLPTPPLSPTTDVECVRYAERAEQIIGYVNGEHEKCLKAENKDGKQVAFVRDAHDRCSVPACQSLHDARTKLRSEASKVSAQCQADLAAHKKRAADQQRAKDEAAATVPLGDPCAKRWQQYEMICVGGSATRSDQQRCQKELNELRAQCPK
jgi:hypothetical protein